MEVTVKKNKYPPEFREEAVKAALSGERSLKDVAKSLGVSYWTLRDWKKEYLANQDGLENRKPGKLSAEAELELLRKENAELRMDNAILKKFAAMLSRDL